MPSIYNYDNPIPSVDAVYYKNVTPIGVTAFHPNAPKGLPGLTAPRILSNTDCYIPGVDHNGGNQIAAGRIITTATTPFDNVIKGDPSSQFEMPILTFGIQSSDIDADPRTTYAQRVRIIMDSLVDISAKQTAKLTSAGLTFAGLKHLYVNLNKRQPSRLEVEQIESAEALLDKYHIPVPDDIKDNDADVARIDNDTEADIDALVESLSPSDMDEAKSESKSEDKSESKSESKSEDEYESKTPKTEPKKSTPKTSKQLSVIYKSHGNAAIKTALLNMERDWVRQGTKITGPTSDIGTGKNKFIKSPTGNIIAVAQVKKLLKSGRVSLNNATYTLQYI
jgi:hypothetical protein